LSKSEFEQAILDLYVLKEQIMDSVSLAKMTDSLKIQHQDNEFLNSLK
jgi:hypothetical protein